ncbi:MAG: relaxase/mobilization nuclease domain-containing protein [Deltaproteobacteria bacterium]|nr:relaxase/mobilization nuclease domain-containing protein [Deltaproteobacteria bacterium]
MIITPKEPRDKNAVSSLSKLVPYMLRGKGGERCTWYMTGNLAGLDRREDTELAVEVMELLQDGNVRAKGDRTYHLIISFHPEDRRLTSRELEDVVCRAVRAAGLEEHQYIAVRHSEQEHEHLHVAVSKIHPETLKIHHPYKAIPAYQALASVLEEELGLRRVDRTPVPSLSHKARDFESHHGIESFSRWARRSMDGGVALDRIESWGALHEELARFGVRLVLRGNGLAVVDANRPNLACKASALGRDWSKQRLCERFGEFVRGPTAVEVARGQQHAYVERPLERARDDGLWREYQDALGAARTRREELRDALSSKINAARASHRRRFKLRHHAIAAMPVSGTDKGKLYKTLSFERRAAERKLALKIKGWRTASVERGPGSWKEFLAARASRGDPKAIRRLARQLRGPAIKSDGKRARALASRGVHTSRGSIVHNLPGGVRLRESAGAIELLGHSRDGALEHLIRFAEQRFQGQRLTLLGSERAREQLAKMAAERGLEIAQERQR